MALSDPRRVVVEAEVGSSETINYGDTVKLVAEYLPDVPGSSPAEDDLTQYSFKWTAYYSDSSPVQEDLFMPTIGIVDAARGPTIDATAGTGRTVAGTAGDKINVVVAGFCLANVNHTGVDLTKDCLLYVGNGNVAGGEGVLVTDIARSVAAEQITADIDDILADDSHFTSYMLDVRARSLVTNGEAGDGYKVVPVMIFNNPFVAG